jgi:alpha-N-arabinofuranosidase
MGWTPMITVNLGTGTPEEARNWVEYCNCPPGSRYADWRAANGYASPFGVKLWCLGNEMDGPWQLGHVPADQYAIRAQQAAKMMRDVDKSIEMVVCGSCTTGLPTYMEWDRQALDYLGDFADYISLHRYVGNRQGDSADYLAVTNSIDQQIEEMDAACRFIQAKRRSKKRAYLCFDEWNVWYKNREMDGAGKFAPHLIEEVYNLEDALVVAGFLNSFIRHADVLKIANLAQIVNVIAPILTRDDEMLLQTIFYPFEMVSKRREGTALRVSAQGPRYNSPSYGSAPVVDVSAIHGENALQLFAINRSLSESAPLLVELLDRPLKAVQSAELLTGAAPAAANSYAAPQAVVSRPFGGVVIESGRARCALPPLSFLAMSLS